VNRSLYRVDAVQGGFEAYCDCGQVTEVQVGPDDTDREAFFICAGCDSFHWFTITSAPAGGPAGR